MAHQPPRLRRRRGRQKCRRSPGCLSPGNRLKRRQRLPRPSRAPTPPRRRKGRQPGAAKPPPQDPLHRDEWVLARPPGHYTLQLLGVEDLAELKDFIRRHQLQGELFYIKTWRNGRPWYPLLFGEFTDKQGALEAKRRLRGKLQRQDAWPRPFAALQAILKRSG